MLGLLCDMPHEVCHILQGVVGQVIAPDADDGWLAEHDPSVCALNLLQYCLSSTSHDHQHPNEQQRQPPPQPPTTTTTSDNDECNDEYDIPGLFESCKLWLSERTNEIAKSLGEDAGKEYIKWRESMGYR